MNRKELLKREIENKKYELSILEEQEADLLKKEAIRLISDYTDKEKIEKFDAIYAFANSCLILSQENEFHNEDNESYAHEIVMEVMAKDKEKFWKYYNSIA